MVALAARGVRITAGSATPNGGCTDVPVDGVANQRAALIHEVAPDTDVDFGPAGCAVWSGRLGNVSESFGSRTAPTNERNAT